MYPPPAKNAFCGAVLALALLFVSCRPGPDVEEPVEPRVPVLLLRPDAGESAPGSLVAFWFELTPQGPVIIPSPAEASLNPFLPWNHARYITAFLPGEDALFAGVNCGGILEFEVNEGSAEAKEIALYYHQGGPVWEASSLVSLFRYKQKPAALLSGDRFFSEDQQPPDPALWTVSFGAGLQSLVLPPLEPFPPVEGWETPVFFQGNDSYWYFRELRRGTNESSYFRTVDISLKGEKISTASFLEAAEPAAVEKAPPLLALVLEEAARLAGRPCTVAAVSPEFPCRRLYRNSGPVPGSSPELAGELDLAGYYRPAAAGREGLAIVLFPDGRAVYGSGSGGPVRDGHFRLPPLPGPPQGEVSPNEAGNFAYTALALAGNVLVAAWEEQSAWNVGSVGFLMLEMDW
jgi:hypothetical protein